MKGIAVAIDAIARIILTMIGLAPWIALGYVVYHFLTKYW